MKIIEIRESFIKIESNKSIDLSAFLHIKDEKNEYIAQVVQVKKAGEINVIYAKILFNYCGAYHPYNKTLPSSNSKIELFTKQLVTDKFIKDNSIFIGEFIDSSLNLPIELENLNKKTLFSIDNPRIINNLISNIDKQISIKTPLVVIDMLGDCVTKNKIIAGKDFKLALNKESLSFIYEDCLNDATSESKNLIKEIFDDLAEYAKTVQFLPFETLKNIIDDLVEKSHIFKLLVLKNKLTKFNKLGYFANTKDEAETLENLVRSPNLTIDISKLDITFQNRYLHILYSVIKKVLPNAMIFVLASNSIDKKNLKMVLTNNETYSIFATHSNFKYLKDIKPLFKNFIVEPSFNNIELFKAYAVFLKAMQKETLLYVGENTEQLPFVMKNSQINIIPEFIKNSSDVNSSETSIEPKITKQDSIMEKILNDSKEETIVADLCDINTETASVSISNEESLEIINKKSQELIDKVSEEIQSDTTNYDNLFTDEKQVSTENETESVELSESDLEEVPQETPNSFSEEFHTETNCETLIELPNEIADLPEDDKVIDTTDDEIVEIENNDAEEIQEEINNSSLETEENIVNNELDIIDSPQDFEDVSKLEELIAPIPEEIEYISVQKKSIEDSSTNENVQTKIEEENFSEFSEIPEISIEPNEDEIPIPLDIISENNSDDIEKSIIEDVDKVFTTMKEDSISEDDLDFIDELNNDDSIIEEAETLEYTEGLEELEGFEQLDDSDEEILTPLTEVSDAKPLEVKESAPTAVPIYEAEIPQEDLIISDPIEQGDSVIHAKYGNGIVEKKIKYGTRTLFSINFDKVGRKLLDPTITEIKRI